MDRITKELLTNISITTLVIAAFGIIINNLYLAQFYISDFNMFQARSIYVGFIFLVFILAHIVFYLALLDTKNIASNTFWGIILNTFLKLVLLSNILFSLLYANEIEERIETASEIEAIIAKLGVISFFLLIMAVALFYQLYKNNGKVLLVKILYWGYIILFAAAALITFGYYFYTYGEFLNVFLYQLYFAFFISFVFIYLWAGEKDRIDGVTYRAVSLFTSESFNEKYWLDSIFKIAYVAIVIIILLSLYSYNIYPRLNTSYGGGKPTLISIDYKGEIIEGKLMHHDESFFYLKKDSSILFLNKEHIEKIRIE